MFLFAIPFLNDLYKKGLIPGGFMVIMDKLTWEVNEGTK